MSGTVTSAAYREHEWYWRFYRAAYRGGSDWYAPDIDGQAVSRSGVTTVTPATAAGNVPRSFLTRYGHEAPHDFVTRLGQSYFPNPCAPVVDTYVSHVLAKDPTREGPPAYEAWLLDPTGIGRDDERQMRELVRRAVTLARVYGYCFSCTDLADAGSVPILTEADRLATVGQPYTYLLTPLDVVGWGTDQRGVLTWARVRQVEVMDTGPTQSGASAVEVYRVWTLTETWLEHGGDERPGTRRVHGLGKVPLDILYAQRDPEGGIIGMSTLRDIAFLARELYNLISERQAILYHNTFPIGFVADPSGRLSEGVEVGNRQWITYDPGQGGAPPSFVAPPLEGARLLTEVITEIVLEIRALAGLSRGRGEQSIAARSADALLVETQDKGAMLRDQAAHLEEWEAAMGNTVLRWSGTPGEVRVSYSRQFNVFALADDLDEALKIRQLSPPDAAWRAIVEDILRRRLADRPAEQVAEMLAELTALKPAPPPPVVPIQEAPDATQQAVPEKEQDEGQGKEGTASEG